MAEKNVPNQPSTIFAKIIDFQKNMKAIKKSAKNPFFKSNYAPLDAIQEAIRSDLSDAGLGYIQTTSDIGLRTTLFDTDGNKIEFDYPCNLQGKPQEIGSSITYAKRYSLVALLGLIIEGDDDDGNEAQKKAEKTPEKPIKWLNEVEFNRLIETQDVEKIKATLSLKSVPSDKGDIEFKMKKEYRELLTQLITTPA